MKLAFVNYLDVLTECPIARFVYRSLKSPHLGKFAPVIYLSIRLLSFIDVIILT